MLLPTPLGAFGKSKPKKLSCMLLTGASIGGLLTLILLFNVSKNFALWLNENMHMSAGGFTALALVIIGGIVAACFFLIRRARKKAEKNIVYGACTYPRAITNIDRPSVEGSHRKEFDFQNFFFCFFSSCTFCWFSGTYQPPNLYHSDSSGSGPDASGIVNLGDMNTPDHPKKVGALVHSFSPALHAGVGHASSPVAEEQIDTMSLDGEEQKPMI